MFWLRPAFSFVAVVAAVMAVGGCDDKESRSDSRGAAIGAGTPVPVAGETQAVATANADAADDPEIWADPSDPSRVVIFGTDKQAGLYTYDITGKITGFIPDGRLNNVDLRDGFATAGGPRVLIAASDRDRRGAALYLMNPTTLAVSAWGVIPLDLAEPYGLCLGRSGADFVVVVDGTDGDVRQLAVSAGDDGKPVARELRRFKLSSQTEGCVIDDARDVLYIGEEEKGIWRFPMAGEPAGTLIAAAPSAMLQPDVEGLALLRDGAGTWLIASSQGDSAFAVWRVDGTEPVYRGRFSGVAAAGVDGVTGTDGVAAWSGAAGPYPEGLIVMQDDVDSAGETASDRRERQNFKLIDWRAVKAALRLDAQTN